MTPPRATTLPFAVHTQQLTQRFGSYLAVDSVDLSIEQGGIHAILGPNGAGKTTLVRILTTLLKASSGHAEVLGYDVGSQAAQVRQRIGLTGQQASLDEDLTGIENLTLLARLLGHRRRASKQRAELLLTAFGLADAAGRQVKKYSGGMRRRLDIAASLLIRPELLFLDEPTTGLDPRSRGHMWDAIRTLVANGTTVVLTTQYLDEADRLADNITVLNAGRIVAQGTPGELKTLVGSGVLRVRVTRPEQRDIVASLLSELLGTPAEFTAETTVVQFRVRSPAAVAPAIAQAQRDSVDIAEFSLSQPSLDEVFLALTSDHSTAQETDS